MKEKVIILDASEFILLGRKGVAASTGCDMLLEQFVNRIDEIEGETHGGF